MLQNTYEIGRPRPPLATAICCWEGFRVVLSFFSLASLFLLQTLLPLHTQPISLLLLPNMILGPCFALAAAILLWNMHRAAFHVLLAAFCLQIFSIPFAIPRILHRRPLHALKSQAMVFHHFVNYAAVALAFGLLILNAAILWYVDTITKPPETSLGTPLPERAA